MTEESVNGAVGNPHNPRLVARVALAVEVYTEFQPGQSNPFTGTELPYEYLVIRHVSEQGAVVTDLKGHLALLEWDEETLDPDGLIEDAVREALSVHAPNPYQQEAER